MPRIVLGSDMADSGRMNVKVLAGRGILVCEVGK